MYALAINGSPRENGNTAILLNTVLEALALKNWDTELFQLAGKKVEPCLACYKCRENRDMHCAIKNDVLHKDGLFEKMIKADAIIIGSPTYFAGITPKIKAVIDRAGFTSGANGQLFAGKIGAAVVALRRGGAINVFDTINHFFLISQMIVPGSTYWNMGFGLQEGEIKEDDEAMVNMNHLAQAINWLGQTTANSKIPYPKADLSVKK